jgi:aminopeptidase-like protein
MAFARRSVESAKRIPLEIDEVPTGTEILDWTVPKEWNLREAHIDDPNGHQIAGPEG